MANNSTTLIIGATVLSTIFGGSVAQAQEAQPVQGPVPAQDTLAAPAGAPAGTTLAVSSDDAPVQDVERRAPPPSVDEICRQVESRRTNFLIFSNSQNRTTIDEACMDYALVYLLLESDNPDHRLVGYLAYGRLNPTIQQAIDAVGQRYGVDVPAIVTEIQLSTAPDRSERIVCREERASSTTANVTMVCGPEQPAAQTTTDAASGPTAMSAAATVSVGYRF